MERFPWTLTLPCGEEEREVEVEVGREAPDRSVGCTGAIFAERVFDAETGQEVKGLAPYQYKALDAEIARILRR